MQSIQKLTCSRSKNVDFSILCSFFSIYHSLRGKRFRPNENGHSTDTTQAQAVRDLQTTQKPYTDEIYSVDFSELPITVTVGCEKKQFMLHPSILSNNSKFFRSSFSGRWTFEKGINLQEVEPSIFQIYAGYVYTGEIELPTISTEDQPPEEVKRSSQHRFEFLIKLYVLANLLEDKALRNTVMDKLQDTRDELHSCPGTNCIEMAYSGTHDTSSLCRWLRAEFLSGTDPKWLETAWPQLPAAFITALMLGWAQSSWDESTVNTRPAHMPKCIFHEHDDEVPMDDFCAQGVLGQKAVPKIPKKSKKTKI